MADTPQDAETAAREALELAEDVLSRYPFSSQMWPNGMHPNTGIEQIRAAIAALRPASSPGKVTVTDAMVEAAAKETWAKHLRPGETWPPDNCVTADMHRAYTRTALTAALLSTTQTEAGNGR